jgi:hypothetical protein
MLTCGASLGTVYAASRLSHSEGEPLSFQNIPAGWIYAAKKENFLIDISIIKPNL